MGGSRIRCTPEVAQHLTFFDSSRDDSGESMEPKARLAPGRGSQKAKFASYPKKVIILNGKEPCLCKRVIHRKVKGSAPLIRSA